MRCWESPRKPVSVFGRQVHKVRYGRPKARTRRRRCGGCPLPRGHPRERAVQQAGASWLQARLRPVCRVTPPAAAWTAQSRSPPAPAVGTCGVVVGGREVQSRQSCREGAMCKWYGIRLPFSFTNPAAGICKRWPLAGCYSRPRKHVAPCGGSCDPLQLPGSRRPLHPSTCLPRR